MKYYTYEDICKLAGNAGIKMNKVTVGIWAKLNGFTEVKREIRDNKFTSLYISEKDLH